MKDWVFGTVWAVLYLIMGYVAGQLKHIPPIFWVQLALNLSWTPVYFGLDDPKLALWILSALWLAILLTIRELGPLGKWFIPYLAWVSFAGYLNWKSVKNRINN